MDAGGTVTVSSYVFPEANPISLANTVSRDKSFIKKSHEQNLIE
jgi:hypothetical protein